MAPHELSPHVPPLPDLPRTQAVNGKGLFRTDPNLSTSMPEFHCLQDVLKERSGVGPSQTIVLYPSHDPSFPTEVSYSTLYAEALQNSVLIRSLKDFREEKPVLLHLDNHWDTILWFWSVLFANGLPVLSTPLSNVEEHRHEYTQGLSTLLESPICITRAEFLPLLDGNHSLRVTTVESLSNNITQHNSSNEIERITYKGGKASSMLMLTSGSTGVPKAVCLTHDQVLAAIAGKASVRCLPANRPFLNWIGLSHVASLVEIHLQALWLGVSQVHVDPADVVASPRIFLDLLSRHRVARSFAPNFFLAKLVSVMESATDTTSEWDLSDLTVLASGGEANDVHTCVAAAALLEKHGAPRNVITTGFGMTETCAGAIFNLNCPDGDLEHSRGNTSLGKCMRGIEMRVIMTTSSHETKLALPDHPGDLEVRGRVVFDSYYRHPAATAEAFTPDGWFRTGDQAIIDSKGNLHLVGRVKDVININGIKFASSDIQGSLEQALNPHVTQIVCFPSRAVHTEQVTVAYIPKEWQVSGDDAIKIQSLAVKACISVTGSRPFVFSLRQESLAVLPRSILGKISRHKMSILFETGTFNEDVTQHRQVVEEFRRHECQRSLETVDFPNEAEANLIEDVAATLGVDSKTIRLDTTIFDLGSTSMDLIRIKHRIDSRLKSSVPLITLMKNPTPRSLALALGLDSSTDKLDFDQSVCAKYDPVITFRSSGSKTPLWLIHPGVGEVLVFVGLAQHLSDDDRPIYALRARGFEAGQKRFASIGEAVDTYSRAIRERQPEGPYAIAGYSYGTMLAFELAKTLNSDNGKSVVRFIGSFNLPPHIKSRMRQLNWNMCLLHLALFLDLTTEAYTTGIDESVFRTLPRDEALTQVLETVNQNRMQELGLETQDVSRWADVAFGLQSMAVDYEPSGEIDVIDVFHAVPLKVAAASRKEWVDDHLSKWRDFCRTQPKFHEVGGAHYTMIGPEHVSSFAIKLKAALRARGL
ncbi:acyl-protein synthetase [Lentithecium fluviatile CBS 122367]|uniref:Acyl-protein synthetase n=1 Tax=Lentithecium fluviatile CBS 122367 TaxID=1168545 RepID=A0A6G1IYY9_9PLEO|nr:acyl-protein synthetase [Lentithecium fluviatile CBS 122367]